MATLKDHHKEFIIKQLASYKSPSEVKKLVQEHFQIEISSCQVVYYDPETARSFDLAEKWKRMYRHTRECYLEEAAKVPIYHQAYRLNEMQKNYDALKSAGNLIAAHQILVDASKEVGGVFEGKNLDRRDNRVSTNEYIKEIYRRIEKRND